MEQQTSLALLEQLVYIDTFVNNSNEHSPFGEQHSNQLNDLTTPNLDMDGQLSLDLAAFADESFIFPDEDKKEPKDEEKEKEKLSEGKKIEKQKPVYGKKEKDETIFNPNINMSNLSTLPKFPVPPGARDSLKLAGLSQNQIDLLSALIAQHQTSLGNYIPSVPQLASQNTQPVRQHNQLEISNETSSISSSSSPGSITSSSTNRNQNPEMDKRRRNTAASARFRIKKKLKEKQMEYEINELNDLVKNFENKIELLEMENKLLKNLIIEKGSQKNEDELRLLKERAKHS